MYQPTAREELENIYSDVSKDAYGCRDRRDLSHLSDEELSQEISDLNRYGWEQTLAREAYDAGEELSWEQISRMTIGEMAHRIGELESRPRIPASGQGWTLTRE